MLQMCASEVAIPLQLIFSDCVNLGTFPHSWKYANVQPIHKKDNRQVINNYRPISLLPMCGKILEKIIFDQLTFMSSLAAITYYLKNNPDLDLVTQAFTNCYL